MSFANTTWTEHHHIFMSLNKTKPTQFLKLRLRRTTGKAKVVIFECLNVRKSGKFK